MYLSYAFIEPRSFPKKWKNKGPPPCPPQVREIFQKICNEETVKFFFPKNVKSMGEKQEKGVFMVKSVYLVIISLLGGVAIHSNLKNNNFAIQNS